MLLITAFFTSCESENDDDVNNDQSNTEIDGNNNTTITEGVFVDSRDGKSYNVILQNGLWWMIENFDYEYEGSNSTSSYYMGFWADYAGDGSYDDPAVFTFYDDRAHPPGPDDNENGLLYTYDAAINAAPNGWRLPTESEWDEFYQYGSNDEAARYIENLHRSASTEIKEGSAPQLLGITYGQYAKQCIWSSSLRSQQYPNGDNRDSFKLIPYGGISDGAHYIGHTVRYVTEEYNFNP